MASETSQILESQSLPPTRPPSAWMPWFMVLLSPSCGIILLIALTSFPSTDIYGFRDISNTGKPVAVHTPVPQALGCPGLCFYCLLHVEFYSLYKHFITSQLSLPCFQQWQSLCSPVYGCSPSTECGTFLDFRIQHFLGFSLD